MPVSLSRRQREVLNGIVRNQTNKEIASMLNISVRTTKFHVSVLLAKFHVHSRVELMLQATSVLPPDALQKRGPDLQPWPAPTNGMAETFLGPPARPRLLMPAGEAAR